MTIDRVLNTITHSQPGDHLSFVYQSEEEHRELVIAYLRLGLEQKERVLYIADSSINVETILDNLQDDGLEVDAFLLSGQLRVVTSAETHLRTGVFNPDDMLAFWREETERALAGGYGALRGASEMNWALEQPGSERLDEYESILNAFLTDARCLIACLYDWRRLTPGMLFSMISAHPLITIGAPEDGRFYHLPPIELMSDAMPIALLNYCLEILAGQKRTEAALADNRQRLEAIFNNALNAILLVDNEMHFVDANPAASALLKYSVEELRELTVMDITPDSNHEQTEQTWQTFVTKGKLSDEYTLLRQDGTIVEVEFHAVTNISPGLHLAMLHDITERKRADAEIHRYTARMEALADISQALAAVGLDVQAVLEAIVRYAAETIGDTARIVLLKNDERMFQPVAFHHPDREIKALMDSFYPATPVSAEPEWLARILKTGEGVLIPEVDPEQFEKAVQQEYLSFFKQVGVCSIVNVPLRADGRVIGTLGLTRDQPGRPYTAEDQAFLQALADRAALTIQNARLFDQVSDTSEQLQVLSRRLLEVQEAERRHIARELHDEIGQVLTGLKLMLETKNHQPVEMIKSNLGDARGLVDKLMEQVDELSLNLRPSTLDDLGLLPTLMGHIEHFNQQTQLKVKFQQNGLKDRRFMPEIETTVFRLIQEALTNVTRHAFVSEVTVRVWVGLDAIGIEVEDQGIGFDPETKRFSAGLSGMRERVVLLGGRLRIDSAHNRGTTITAELPILDSDERSDDDDNRPGR